MQESKVGGPSLIKLGKLANSKDFNALDSQWLTALENPDYTWRELIPIAGQVGRLGAGDRAGTLFETLVGWVGEKQGNTQALAAVREAAKQLPQGVVLRSLLRELYLAENPDFAELPQLLDTLMPAETTLDQAVIMVDLYLQLQQGLFAIDRDFLVPGQVEAVSPTNGVITIRFEDRHAEYGPATVNKLTPRPADHFPALLIYDPSKLVDLAQKDSVAFVKLALQSQRESRLPYRELKDNLTLLLGDKGWKNWWKEAKSTLKRDPLVGMSSGSQPSFWLLRREDHYEERLRRQFDLAKSSLDKLLKVMGYLDELSQEEKQGGCDECADEKLLVHFGNGAAKVAVSVLAKDPALALAGLALHAEVAARGVPVARPNPKAGSQVLAKIADPSKLADDLPEALLQRVLEYLRSTQSEQWGPVWGGVLTRAGKRLCDFITRGLIEGGKDAHLEAALLQGMEKPTSSPELLGWLWRTWHTSGPASKFLKQLPSLSEDKAGTAMFSLLDSVGRLYGMSMDEKHAKLVDSARAALSTQNNRPLLAILEAADRPQSIRWKRIIEKNAGLSPTHRTQLLGFMRSRYADIFHEATREWEDPEIIYTTEDGLRRTQDALNHIIEVEIPEVAQQIGVAASFGDLSENAEYTAALEKRDQLVSRAASLDGELAQAKIISLEMATGDLVNVGVRVTARSLVSGEEEIFTFLGPWDTDTQNQILNYQAPLAQAFMGARKGDQVEFGDDQEKRSWEVLSVESAL